MLESRYTLTPSPKSRCIRGHAVSLLSPIEMESEDPWFYICFECRFVGEVGKGPVLAGFEVRKKEG